MKIEFQNCSLEIGYIGTPDEIMMVMLKDACQTAADVIADFSRRFVTLLAEVFGRGAKNLRAWLAKDGACATAFLFNSHISQLSYRKENIARTRSKHLINCGT